MFYRLKKGLMCRALEKRNKEKPFDYSYAENFTLDGETDILLNNSYYFSAHSGEMSFFARLGKRVHEDETWFALYLEGKLYSLKQESFRSGEHIGSRPGKNRVLYRQAREVVISSKDLIDLYLDGEQLPGSQFHLKILPGALPLRLPKLETE